MHERTKAVAIKPAVRRKVEARDNYCCIFCGSPHARGEAHFINRSQGGLGIEENLVTVCRACHAQMDDGQARTIYRNFAESYLKTLYPDWDKAKLVFDKHKN